METISSKGQKRKIYLKKVEEEDEGNEERKKKKKKHRDRKKKKQQMTVIGCCTTKPTIKLANMPVAVRFSKKHLFKSRGIT